MRPKCSAVINYQAVQYIEIDFIQFIDKREAPFDESSVPE